LSWRRLSLACLQAAIRQTIDGFGETIPVRVETTATFGPRDEGPPTTA
jgi:hypothetical protein